MQHLWTQGASKSGKFVTRNEGSQVNLAELMTKPPPRPRIEQLTKAMGNRLMMEESSGKREIAKCTTWHGRCLLGDARRELEEHPFNVNPFLHFSAQFWICVEGRNRGTVHTEPAHKGPIHT